MNAVRTLAPTTLGATSWQVPITLTGAPDLSGRHAAPYSAVELAASTLASHEQEPLHRAAMSLPPGTLPLAQTPSPTSPAMQSSTTASDAQQGTDGASQSASVDNLSHATTKGPLLRRMSWGLAVAVVAIAGVWIASDGVGPDEATLKDVSNQTSSPSFQRRIHRRLRLPHQ